MNTSNASVLTSPCWIWATSQQVGHSLISFGKRGKWMLFCDPLTINSKWEQVCNAVESGILWQAKRSTEPKSKKENNFVIIIYTRDYTDLSEVIRVLDYLEASHIKRKNDVIYYKTDDQTRRSIYSGEGEYAWIYASNTIRQSSSSYHDSKTEKGAPQKLSVQFMPSTGWLTELHQVLPPQHWQALKAETLQEHNRCVACHCEEKSLLNCSSVWSFDENNNIQRLEGVEALCQPCFEVKHAYPDSLLNDIKMHLGNVNQWDIGTLTHYITTEVHVWSKRSQTAWNIDLSWLKNKGYPCLKQLNADAHDGILSNLFIAVLNSHLEKIATLLSSIKTKKAICEKNRQGESVLLAGIRNNRKDIVELLLTNELVRKHLLSQGKQGKLPLAYTIELGLNDLSILLLKAGANPLSQDKFGRTPLHIAAIYKNPTIAQLIMQLVPAASQALDRYQRRACDYAVSNKQHEIMVNDNEAAMLALFLDSLQPEDFLYQDSYGQTILHHAVFGLSENSFENLLIGKAKNIINLVDCYGKTALHTAAVKGFEDKLVLLLKHGADPTILSAHGRTAYEEARICVNLGPEKAKTIFKDYVDLSSYSSQEIPDQSFDGWEQPKSKSLRSDSLSSISNTLSFFQQNYSTSSSNSRVTAHVLAGRPPAASTAGSSSL